MNVGEMMTQDLITCAQEDTITQVAQKLQQENIGSCPVVENQKLVGIITDRDIAIRAVAKGLDPNTTRVNQVMSTDLVTANPSMSLEEVCQIMSDEQIRRLPVVDEQGLLLGVVTQADLAVDLEEEEMIAEVVERISEPSHTHSQ